MTTVLLVVHFFIAAFLVISILLQRSEGGALSGLGGGSSGLMTARGQANLLTRITSILVAAFFSSSILIAILLHSPEGGRSVFDKEAKRPVPVETKKAEEAATPLTAQPHTEGENPPVPMPAAEAAKPEEGKKTPQ